MFFQIFPFELIIFSKKEFYNILNGRQNLAANILKSQWKIRAGFGALVFNMKISRIRPATISGISQYRDPVLLSPENEPKLFCLVQLTRVSWGHGDRDLTHFQISFNFTYFSCPFTSTLILPLFQWYMVLPITTQMEDLGERIGLVLSLPLLLAQVSAFSCLLNQFHSSICFIAFKIAFAVFSCHFLPISPCMFVFREKKKNLFTAGLVEFGGEQKLDICSIQHLFRFSQN